MCAPLKLSGLRPAPTQTDAQSRPLTAQITGILPVTYTYDARGRLASVSQGSGAATQSVSYAYTATRPAAASSPASQPPAASISPTATTAHC